VVITEEYKVMVSSVELIGTTEWRYRRGVA